MEFPEMKSDISRAKTVLHDLQKFARKENKISTLITLNEIISRSQEEIECFYNSDGIDVIVSLLKSDSNLADICVRLLANAAKRHEKVRKKLLENKIFYLLAEKLKEELDFFNNNLLLYSVLFVVLLQGDCEAQNQMGTSGCLSTVVRAITCILESRDTKPLSSKTTELLIYTIIASSKEPRHFKNQTEAGWIIPKILEYLDKQMIFSGSGQLHIIKCFWFFLKTALDKNESNQEIFLESLGLCVLFRSIQDVIEGHCNEMTDLLVKMTGVLVKLKSNKEFLFQASNYCPVVILCSLLKTYNTLVIQQTIIFMNSLTKEFPNVLRIMKSIEILRGIKRAKLILLGSKSEELCRDLWNRIKTSYQSQEFSLSPNTEFGLSLKNESQPYGGLMSELRFSQTHFCVVHDAELINSQISSKFLFNESTKNKRNESSRKFSPYNIYFQKKLRGREIKFRKIIKKNLSSSHKNNCGTRFKITAIADRIKKIFQKFTSFFSGPFTNDIRPICNI